jgi:opacity protein-like surface antigen
MKKILLMAGVAAFAFASNANALEVNPYVSAKLSYNWAKNDVISEMKEDDYKESFKTKFHKNVWGGHFAAGAKAGAIRSEIEWNHWQDAKRTYFYDGGKYRMRLQNNALLLNAYYDINTCTRWTPYVGAGLGVAMLKITSNDMWDGAKDKESDRTYNFAWQIGAGVAYDLTSNVALDAGYRYVNAGAAVANKEIYSGRGYYSEKDKIDTAAHEIYFGARYTF